MKTDKQLERELNDLCGVPTERYIARWFPRCVSWLKVYLHKHSWEETRWNTYGIGIEEHCRRCGAYRHHYFENLKNGLWNPPDWQPGRHKNKDWHEPDNSRLEPSGSQPDKERKTDEK